MTRTPETANAPGILLFGRMFGRRTLLLALTAVCVIAGAGYLTYRVILGDAFEVAKDQGQPPLVGKAAEFGIEIRTHFGPCGVVRRPEVRTCRLGFLPPPGG